MKNKKLLVIGSLLVLIFLSASIFSIAFSYKVFTNFNLNDVYTRKMFSEDIEFGITIMIANVVGELFLFYYLFKSKTFQKVFKKNDKQ